MQVIPAAITMRTASKGLADLCRAIDGGETEFSAEALAHSDSSAVAVLIAAIRHGRQAGKAIRVTGLPASLHSLARLYGVDGLIEGDTAMPAGAVPASQASAITTGTAR